MTDATRLPHVAVSIINYRTAEMTLACLRSVLAAAEAEPQVRVTTVVIDNASGDGSAETIADWIAAEGLGDRIRLIRSPVNSGFSGGHNLGIGASEGPFVLLLNSDAELVPGFFAPLLAAADRDPKAGLFVPRIEGPDGTPHTSCFRLHSPLSELIRAAGSGPVTRLLGRHVLALPNDADPGEIDWVSFACVLLRREMIEAIGPMDEGYFLYFEDCEYALRARRAGWHAAAVPHSVARHAQGGSGAVPDQRQRRARLPEYYYRSRSRLFYQAHGRIGLLAANLAWYVGRGLAMLRPLTGRAVPRANAHEARDIWIGFRAPLAASGRPGT